MPAGKTPQDMAVLPTAVVVCSESDPAEVYHVQLPYCPCKDFRYRRAQLLAGTPGLTVDDLFCKHLRKGLALVGGWHGTPEPAAETTTYYRLTNARAFTLLTSAHLAASLADALMRAARAAEGMEGIAATVRIANGDVTVKFDVTNRCYDVTLPASQPVAEPAALRG
jgi:hypothetical protein